MLSTSRVGWLLLAGFAVIYLATLGVRPLMRHDEFRYAEIPREMLVSGDFVVPRLNGLRYFEKPVFSYWAGAASQWLLGETRFAVRLVSALATGFTALFLGLFVARFGGDSRAGVLAAFIFLTSLLVFVLGTFNIPDPLLMLWITLTIGSYYWAHRESRPGPQRAWLAAAGAAAGLGFLTKGFLGFLVPGLVLLPVWLARWRAGGMLRFLLVPALAAAVVAAPWAWAIHGHEPAFWEYFFWEQNVQRFASDSASHAQPAWFYLALLPALLLPWSFLVPAALAGLNTADHASRRLTVFLAGWFLIPFVFYSVASGKLLTYILPCLPPLAMLIALGIRPAAPRPAMRLLRGGIWVLAGFYALLLVAVLVNGLGLAGEPLYGAAERASWITLLLAIGVAPIVALAGLRSAAQGAVPVPAGLSILLLYLVLPFIMPASQKAFNMPEDFLRAEARLTSPDTMLIASGTLVRSVDWTFRRSDVYVLDAEELGMGLDYPDARGRLIGAAELQEIVGSAGPEKEILIIVTDRDHDVLDPLMVVLPASVQTTAHGNFLTVRMPARAR